MLSETTQLWEFWGWRICHTPHMAASAHQRPPWPDIGVWRDHELPPSSSAALRGCQGTCLRSPHNGIAQGTGSPELKEGAELMGLGLHNGQRVNRGSEKPRPISEGPRRESLVWRP